MSRSTSPDPNNRRGNLEGADLDSSSDTIEVWDASRGEKRTATTGDVVGKSMGATLPVTVADADARKNADSYATAFPGGLRVIQSDLPGVLWSLIASDVTLDASWIGQPYTVDPDGDIIVNLQLADVYGTAPDYNVLGSLNGLVTKGNGLTSGGVSSASRKLPDGVFEAEFMYTSASTCVLKHDGGGGASGIVYILNGAAPVYTAVAAGVILNVSIPGLRYNKLQAYPATAGGNWAPAGSINHVNARGAFGMDISGLALEHLTLWSSHDQFLDVRSPLGYFFLNEAGFVELDLRPTAGDILVQNCPRLVNVTYPDVTPGDTFQFFGNDLVAGTVNCFGFTGGALTVENNDLVTAVDMTGTLGGVTLLYCNITNNPSLSSIIVDGYTGTSSASSYYGTNLSGNILETDAIYDFLDGCGSAYAPGHYINLVGNPCISGGALIDGATRTAAETIALAAAKFYTLKLT